MLRIGVPNKGSLLAAAGTADSTIELLRLDFGV